MRLGERYFRAKSQRKKPIKPTIMTENELAKIIVNTCYNIHVELGPGLLESVYEEILYYDKKSGDKLDSPDEEDPEDVREKREPALHSILHYINKDDPLGDTKPDRNSEMYFRWEKAVNEKGADAGEEK